MTIINNIEIDNIKYNENDIKKAILNNDPIEDKLHVIIVLSNPCNYAIRYILTKEFIRRMKDETNVILYIVELAYFSQDYHITELSNDKHLRLRSSDAPIWHKENMINIGIKKLLPSNWKAVAWIDADIEFDSPTWATDTLKVLNGCKDIVQLFSHNVFMDANGDTELLLTGLGFQHVKKTSRSNRIKDINSYWHPGFAWACTRKFYEKMGGLYEYAITGDGDMQMSSCFLSNYASALPSDVSDDYKKSLKEFENRVKGCRIGYIPGIIRHYYHGSINSRKYDLREHILTRFNYAPSIHLKKNKDGLLIPTDDCPKELIESITNHFQSKNEDASISPFLNNKNIESNDTIDLIKLLQYFFTEQLSINCILLNLKKDIFRFNSAKEELKKLTIPIGTFTHFDATYWKDIKQFEKDINFVIDFLRKFNTEIKNGNITINDFSEPNDTNILIQSAPLACYCSHVKAMIHGYLNFEKYTIICEDDISIEGISNIQNYLNNIPNDWDIICFNSQPKHNNHKNNYYKFNDIFYHLHFYIIRNDCFDKIFQNLYPITDQIDILLSKLHNKLNIYNISNTIIQKNFITNIQNNLHIIYNTPVYLSLVKDIEELESEILIITNSILTENDQYNKSIANKIIEDIIYNNIFGDLNEKFDIRNDKLQYKDEKYPNLFHKIKKIVHHFIKEEGNNVSNFILHMIGEIDFILYSFKLHNKYNDNLIIKAFNFGSTSSVYMVGDKIFKVYNERLRWINDNHNKIMEIFNKEIKLLKKINPTLDYNNENLIIIQEFKGISLKENFVLPNDYKVQITKIFDDFNLKDIYYPEFNINNIVVNKENKISFIDFGLAHILKINNNENCRIFLELLDLLNNRLSKENSFMNEKQKRILLNSFMKNMRNNKKYTKNIF